MGCSPSKGKLFGGAPEAPGIQEALLDKPTQDNADFKPVEVADCSKIDEGENKLLPAGDQNVATVEFSMPPPDTVTIPEGGSKDIEVNMMPPEAEKNNEPMDTVKNVEKRRKNKGLEKSKRKEKRTHASFIQGKLDLPPHMVRAHQAAYAYLNPKISKYEALLGLLDQAAQTHISTQPTMKGLVLRFEEVNQAMEEMAEEGELMLKEHGDYMGWPSGMNGLIPGKGIVNTSKPPPDLLQQMLQHSIESLRQLGESAQGLGDTTLEEAVEYYSSLAKLLTDKLHAKQAAEQRLGQVLLRVENATMRKFNPEDISLHSEDSGIGGENESLAGSERHRRHRGSAGSASCGSRCSIRLALDTAANNFPNQAGLNEDDEEDEDEEEEEEDDEDEDEEDGEEEGARFGRERSNSSPPDPSRPQALHMNSESMQGHQARRPVTAAPSARPGVLLTTRCAEALLELQKSQKGLDQHMRQMDERWGDKETSGAHYSVHQDGLRRSLSICGGASSLPPLEPHPPGHNSVRKLINTFSHGVDGRPGQSLVNTPPHIRRPRRSGTLLLPDIGDGGRPLIANGNNNNNSWPDGHNDDDDVDSLPPPPLEVLMDNSFSTVENSEDDLESHEYSDRGRPVINKRTGASQRLRASVQNVPLLPNRASVRQRSTGVTPVHPVRQNAVVGQDFEQQLKTELDPESEKVSALYQQARKIIHLCNVAESPVWQNQADHFRPSSPLEAELVSRQRITDHCEAETPPRSLPVMAPPVSRVRLPPSCPTSVHQRYPCPPAFRAQPTSGPTSRPASRSSSRSSSPRATTWARQNSAEEIIPSVSFGDARSVFCQNGPQTSPGRLPLRRTESSARRIQSERRSSMNLHPQGSQNDGT